MRKTFPLTIGIQVWPHAILDEGIEQALDLMQESVAMNCLMLYSHAYYGAANGWRNANGLAGDHGIELHEHPVGTLDGAWVRHTPGRFAALKVGHRDLSHKDQNPYGMDDPYRAILEAAHKRGMKVYARYLEGWEPSRMKQIPRWPAEGIG